MESKSCSVIGQRPARFKFGYKENNAGCKRLKKGCGINLFRSMGRMSADSM